MTGSDGEAPDRGDKGGAIDKTIWVPPAERGTPLRWADEPPSTKIGMPMTGSLGKFLLGEFLARGGCGAVYAATEQETGRRVAIKVMHQELAQHKRAVERFLREVEVIRLLHHPHVVEILDAGVLPDGRPFYVMEFLDGQTLKERIAQDGRLSAQEALELIDPVCVALAAAHAAGIVHRDVKTANIFLKAGAPREVKLLDFGIAKLLDTSELRASWLTTDGHFLGTVTNVSPEQIRGGPVDARVDIYALGVVLYTMLTGVAPFRDDNDMNVLMQHLEAPAPRPSLIAPILPELDAVVLRCMEKDPQHRYASIEQFLDALRSVVAGRGFANEPPADVRTTALGVCVALELDADELDEPLASELGRVFDVAEQRLAAAGFLSLMAEDHVLGVRRLPDGAENARRAIREGLATAAALHEELCARSAADPRLRIGVRAHVGDVVLTAGAQPEIAGGALIRIRDWTSPLGEQPRFDTTPAVAAMLSDGSDGSVTR